MEGRTLDYETPRAQHGDAASVRRAGRLMASAGLIDLILGPLILESREILGNVLNAQHRLLALGICLVIAVMWIAVGVRLQRCRRQAMIVGLVLSSVAFVAVGVVTLVPLIPALIGALINSDAVIASAALLDVAHLWLNLTTAQLLGRALFSVTPPQAASADASTTSSVPDPMDR